MKERGVCFLTGASSGLGRGLAVRLARAGYALGLAARRESLLEEVAGEIRSEGGRAGVYPCDVAERNELLGALARCRDELGEVDLLVANAGISTYATPEELDGREVERVFRINFFGAVTATEAVLPAMLERGGGQIVVVGSLAGYQGLLLHGTYSATKGALYNFYESLRLDVMDRGVDVTIITPGFVKTAMTAHNRYPMPFLMDLDPALDIMVRGILKSKKVVRFPRILAATTWWGRVLPRGIFDWLVGRIMGRKGRGSADGRSFPS